MPSRIRLIAIDIDGTLLPSVGTTISERNCRALRRAQDAGLHVVIATGRRHQYAEPVLEQVVDDRYAKFRKLGPVTEPPTNGA